MSPFRFTFKFVFFKLVNIVVTLNKVLLITSFLPPNSLQFMVFAGGDLSPLSCESWLLGIQKPLLALILSGWFSLLTLPLSGIHTLIVYKIEWGLGGGSPSSSLFLPPSLPPCILFSPLFLSFLVMDLKSSAASVVLGFTVHQRLGRPGHNATSWTFPLRSMKQRVQGQSPWIKFLTKPQVMPMLSWSRDDAWSDNTERCSHGLCEDLLRGLPRETLKA